MRILHVGKYFPPARGGIESFTADIASAQASRGHRVAVLAHGQPGEAASGPLRIERVTVARSGTPFAVAFAPVSPQFPQLLRTLIKRLTPDILHFHLPNASALMAMAMPVARRIPWVAHWHSDIVASQHDTRLRLLYPGYRPFERAFLRRCARIIATSPPYLQTSPVLTEHSDRCTVIPLGIDTRRLDDRANGELPWGTSSLRVLCIGRFTYYKGIERLIDAIAATADVELIIGGEGPLASDYAELIRRLEVGDRVHVCSPVDDETRNQMLYTCDIVALPSLERTEAFGLVLLEAMHHAKPVIAARIEGSGVPWVVETGNHGWLADPADRTQWVRQLEAARDDPEERRRRGLAGRAALAKTFAIDRAAETLDRVYAEVLG